MKVGLLGSGTVAQTLGNGFVSHGYEVMLGTRNPAKLADWKADAGEAAHVGSFKEAAAFATSWFWRLKEPQQRASLNMPVQKICMAKPLSMPQIRLLMRRRKKVSLNSLPVKMNR